MPEAALPDDGEMTFLFKHGQWVEKEVYDEMAEAGYEVVEQQRPFHDESIKVKGKIDGKLQVTFGGKRIRPPFEIKGYAPYTWDQINSAKDMLEAHQGYLKKVPAQVTLYLVLDKEQEADSAILFMKNKLTGKPKTIVVPRDNVYAEWLLHRLQLVRRARPGEDPAAAHRVRGILVREVRVPRRLPEGDACRPEPPGARPREAGDARRTPRGVVEDEPGPEGLDRSRQEDWQLSSGTTPRSSLATSS